MAPTSPLLAADSTITPNPAKIELPAEIWDQITRLLHRPLPRPTGRNNRSTVRQPDLAACMRVSKLLSNSAAPLLYTHIIVDSLPLLVVGLDRSTLAEGFHSKRQLLEYTKGLGLEYSRKNDGSYLSLMTDGKLFATMPLSSADLRLVCRDEIYGITDGAEDLLGRLPHLETLSCAAYLDSQRAVWQDYYDTHPAGLYGLRMEVGSGLAKLAGLASLRAFCQKAEWRPLALNSYLWVDPKSPKLHNSIHITHIEISHALGHIPAVINSSSRWLVRHEADRDPDWRHALLKRLNVFKRVQALRYSVTSRSGAKPWTTETSAFDIDIFLPSWLHTLALPNIQAQVRAVMVKLLDDRDMPKVYLEPDRFAFYKDEDAKGCVACGQCNEDLL